MSNVLCTRSMTTEEDMTSNMTGDEVCDETGSERAISEASTHAESFPFVGSKRAKKVWDETNRVLGSKGLTQENLRAVCQESSLGSPKKRPFLEPAAFQTQVKKAQSMITALDRDNRFLQTKIPTYIPQCKSLSSKTHPRFEEMIEDVLKCSGIEDIFKASCLLGCFIFSSNPIYREHVGPKDFDTVLMGAAGEMRKIVNEMQDLLKDLLQDENIGDLFTLISVTILPRFRPKLRWSEEGDAFVWRLASGAHSSYDGDQAVNSLAATALYALFWASLKEVHGQIVGIPRFSACRSGPHWCLHVHSTRTGSKFRWNVLQNLPGSGIESSPTPQALASDGQPQRQAVANLCPVSDHADIYRAMLVEVFRLIVQPHPGHPPHLPCQVLNWSVGAGLDLCCHPPFMGLLHAEVSAGRFPTASLASLQRFRSAHAPHAPAGPACAPCAGGEACEPEAMWAAIARHLEEPAACRAAAACCSPASLLASTRTAVGAADALLRRAEEALSQSKARPGSGGR